MNQKPFAAYLVCLKQIYNVCDLYGLSSEHCGFVFNLFITQYLCLYME